MSTYNIAPGANLRKADLRGVDLRGVDLRGVDFYAARLNDADLREAKMYGANLSKADLRGVDLAGANLIRVDFYAARLNDADLRGAKMYGANLRWSDLTNTCLDCADLRCADLGHARGIIDGGADARGYRFVGVQQDDVGLRISAGCRWFTAKEAEAHWYGAHADDHYYNKELRHDTYSRAQLIITIARVKGWIT